MAFTLEKELSGYRLLGNIYTGGNPYTQESLKKGAKKKKKATSIAQPLPVKEDDYGRRIFTYAEKSAALKRTGGICACCGKKLSVSKMTAEHVIPVCWGGSNKPENIIALCEDCNKRKGGRLYLPEGFYTAILGKPVVRSLERMFAEWFKEECSDGQFDLESFPLIAPETNGLLISPATGGRHVKAVYAPQFVMKWKIAGNDREQEIEDLTGMSVEGIRKRMCDLEGLDDGRVALYTLEKASTGHIMMLMAVMYRSADNAGAIWSVWADTSLSAIRMGTENMCLSFAYAITKIAGKDLLYYHLYSTVDGALGGIRANNASGVGYAWAEMNKSGVADSLIVSLVDPRRLPRSVARPGDINDVKSA